MAIRPIRKYGDPVLRKKATRVELFDAELHQLFADMVDTMQAAHGIGLAANQIGRSESMCVIDEGLIAEGAGASAVSEAEQGFAEPSDESAGTEFVQRVRAFVNPRLIEESRDEAEMEEGCLSIPGINETVMRKRQIRVRYQDLQGREHEESCSNLLARVLQHEMDHLNGGFFIDRIGSVRRKLLTKKLKAIAEEAQQEVLQQQKKNATVASSARAGSNL